MSLILLPSEILLQIFGYLSPFQQFSSVLTVCKQFYRLSGKACAGLRRFERPPARIRCPSLPLCALDGWVMDPRHSERSLLTICTDVEIKSLLQYFHIPSIRGATVELSNRPMFHKDLRIEDWVSLKPSCITALQFTCCWFPIGSLEIMLSRLPFLSHLDLTCRDNRASNVLDLLVKHHGSRLKSLILNAECADRISDVRSLIPLSSLEFVKMDVRNIMLYRQNVKFHDIFPLSIRHIRLHGDNPKAEGYDNFLYDNEQSFLECLHNLNRLRFLPRNYLTAGTYSWKCFMPNEDETHYRDVALGSSFASIQTPRIPGGISVTAWVDHSPIWSPFLTTDGF